MDEQNEQNQRPPDQREQEPIGDIQPELVEQPAAPPLVDTPQPEPVQPIAEEPVAPVPVPVPTPVPPPGQIPPGSAQQLGPPSWQPTGDTSIYVVIGFVFVFIGMLSICCCPFVFSIPGMILGAIAYYRGDKLGLVVLIVGGVTCVLWVVLMLVGTIAMPLQNNLPHGWPTPGRPT